MLTASLLSFVLANTVSIGTAPAAKSIAGAIETKASDEKAATAIMKKEVDRLLSECEPGDATRFIQIAKLAAKNGLREGVFTALDRALAAGADAEKVNEILRPLASSEIDALKGSVLSVRAQSLFSSVAKNTTSPANIAYARLALLSMPAAELKRECEFAIVAADARTRLLATDLLGTLGKDIKPEPLVRRIFFDKDPSVRKTASAALASRDDAKITNRFVNALAEPSYFVRMHSAEALGEFKKMEAVPALIKRWNAIVQAGSNVYAPRAYMYIGNQQAYVAGYNVEVAQASAIAEPEISTLMDGVVLDVRILSTSVERQMTLEKKVIQNALAKIAGADHGENPGAWAAWFKNKSAPAPVTTGAPSDAVPEK
ncbi:MAG: HEAT repeat domain-containing protein [Planctomycetota bacterium]